MTQIAEGIPENSDRPRRKMTSARPIIWVALGIFILTLAGNLLSPGPVLQVDESAYLLNAAAIAGKLQYSALLFDYWSGYSLLLAPAYLLFSDFDRIYRAVLATNALIALATPFALFRLTSLIRPDLRTAGHVLVIAAASSFAFVLTIGQYALSENALIPLYAWAIAFAATTLIRDEGRIRAAALCGLCSGSLVLVHARGFPMAVGVLLACSIPCFWRRELRSATTILWLCAGAAIALHFPIEYLAGKSGEHQPIALATTSNVLGHVSSMASLLTAARNVVGVMTYLVIASIGFIFVGLLGSLKKAYRAALGHIEYPAASSVRLVCAAGLIACVVTTAIFFVPPVRVDHVIYGRYALPAVIPLLALGGIQYISADRMLRLRQGAIAIGSGLLLILTTALMLRHWPYATPNGLMPLNIIGLYVPEILEAIDVDWSAAATCFAVSAAVVYALGIFRAAFGLAAFILFNVGVAIYFMFTYTLPARIYYGSDRDIITNVHEFEKVTGRNLCLRIDPQLSITRQFDFQTRLFDRIAASTLVDRTHCLEAVVTFIHGPNLQPSMRLAAAESLSPSGKEPPIGLFVSAGMEFDTFASGRVLPKRAEFLPLPKDSRIAEVQILGIEGDSIELLPGQTLELTVLVRNSTDSTWRSRATSYPVRLGARALLANGTHPEYRSPLSHPLAPGESEQVKISVGAFDSGQFQLVVGMLQDGVDWFSGSRTLNVKVSR